MITLRADFHSFEILSIELTRFVRTVGYSNIDSPTSKNAEFFLPFPGKKSHSFASYFLQKPSKHIPNNPPHKKKKKTNKQKTYKAPPTSFTIHMATLTFQPARLSFPASSCSWTSVDRASSASSSTFHCRIKPSSRVTTSAPTSRSRL